MGGFLYEIIHALISLLIWAIIISAILSWLVAFNVINLRNQFVYNVARTLDAITRPVLAPVQRLIPPLGGVDISPVIVIIVLSAFNERLLPWLFGPVINALGG